jgi:GAF domain-containing protein
MTAVSDAVKSMLAHIVRQAAALTEARMVALWLADEETASLRVAAVSHESADNHLRLVTLAFGQGGVGWVAVERAPLEVDDVFADSRFLGRDWWRSHGLSSFLGLPMVREGRLLGVLALNDSRPLRLSVAEREQLEMLVDQAAHALHSTRLEAEAARQREELAAHRAVLNARLRETAGLLAVARVVGTTTDLTRALRLICRELGALTGADTVAAYLLDRVHHQEVQPVAGYHVPESLLAALAESSVRVEELQFSNALFNDQRAVWTDDAPGDARFANSLFARFPHQSALVIPLIVDAETSGGFYLVWWSRQRQFEYEEIETLEAIGGQVGVLLRNARLREALEHRTTRLRELVRVNQVLSSSLDSREVLTEIARAAARLSGAAGVVFYIADPVKRTLEVRAVSDEEAARDFPIRVLPFGHGGAGWIAVNQRVLDVPDVFADARLIARDWYARHGLRSFYGMPVILDGALVAVLVLTGRTAFRFGPDDQDLLDNFCRQAGLAIRNAELFAAERRAEALRAVAQLANGAAHEINNPLTVICGRLSMLTSRTNDPEVLRQLEAGLDAAYRIRAIIERMMRITRLESADLPGNLPPALDIERSSADPASGHEPDRPSDP